MTRKLKFRAYDTIDKEWLFGYKLPNLGGFSIVGEVVLFGELNTVSLERWNDVDIMQYTGLKDKNGVDIYEGDILKHHNSRPITKEEYWYPVYKVIWEGVGFHLNHIGGGKSSDNSMFYLRHYPNEMEVIGNIHDNPELIG